jgi:hyperosmotically inducible periplasmic protein
MKHSLITASAIVAFLSGCNGPAASTGTTGTDSKQVAPDNTGANAADRNNEAAKTPIDQNENQADIDVTANIRKRVVDTKMSVNAQNVKIITQDGKVTLRGPVKSAEEKQQIEDIANDVAGKGKVDNQIAIEQ